MSSPILDYGPPLPWRKRRRVRRAAILIALAILIGSAPWWGDPIYRHANVLYWQHQCMNYKLPAEGIPAGTMPKELTRFHQAINAPLPRIDAIIFIGMLRSPDGQPRLAVVGESLSRLGGGASVTDDILFYVTRPGTLTRAPQTTCTLRGWSKSPRNEAAIARLTKADTSRGHLILSQPDRTINLWLKNDDSFLVQEDPPN